MESDWESTFEFVSESGEIRKITIESSDVDTTDSNISVVEVNELLNDAAKKSAERIRKRRIRKEKFFFEVMASIGFISTIIIIWLTDMIDITTSDKLVNNRYNIMKEAEKSFQRKILEFTAEIKMNGRSNRPPRTEKNAELFYLLSETQPIDVAFRREWIADSSFFEGVDRFVRGMDWENTFEEDLFTRGVPNFDHKFELEEMTLKTVFNEKSYNKKFLNLGRKEMIDKGHSVEYFISQRILVRLEKKNGIEVSRTEYFLKFGDLHVYDKRGDLECTRVYYAPVIQNSLMRRINKQ